MRLSSGCRVSIFAIILPKLRTALSALRSAVAFSKLLLLRLKTLSFEKASICSMTNSFLGHGTLGCLMKSCLLVASIMRGFKLLDIASRRSQSIL